MRKKQKMLFGKKNCKNCGSSYDIAEDTCPACHDINETFNALHLPKNVIWLPAITQLILFGIGYVGIDILSFIGQIIIANFFEEIDATYYMIINTIRYVGAFAAMFIVLTPYLRKFAKHLKKVIPYLIGVLGFMALIGFNIIYNGIVSLFYTTSESDNQAVANSMISTYPVLCVFVLGIIGPLVEEGTFRLGMFNFLLRVNKWVAYVVTILFFGFIHFNFFAGSVEGYINELLNLPSYLFAGFALTFLYHKFGFGASATAHILNNLYSVIIFIIVNALK